MSSEKNSSKNIADMKPSYKNKILFGRLSKAGNHIYCYQHEAILSPGVKSLLINVGELQDVISGKSQYVKISAMEANEEDSAMAATEEPGDDLSPSPGSKEQSTLPGGSAEETGLFGNLDCRKVE